MADFGASSIAPVVSGTRRQYHQVSARTPRAITEEPRRCTISPPTSGVCRPPSLIRRRPRGRSDPDPPRTDSVTVAVLQAFAPGIAAAAPLKAGVAKVDITNREAGPVNDPLYVKALVLKDGATTAAIVTVDAVADRRDRARSATTTSARCVRGSRRNSAIAPDERHGQRQPLPRRRLRRRRREDRPGGEGGRARTWCP